MLVFRRDASGNVAPLRRLTGHEGNLNTDNVAVDPVHDLLVVSTRVSDRPQPIRSKLQIFSRTAEGNARPLRVITGEKSHVTYTSGPFVVYPPTGKIIAGMRGESGERIASEDSMVGVWSINDNGDVPPQYTIGGPNGILQMVRGVAVNAKHKELIVTDKRLNAVLTFYFPEIF